MPDSVFAPGPPGAGRHLPRAFDAPGFRWLWLTSLFNAVSWTVQSLSVGWLVLDLTNSPMWVGAVAAARGVGMFAFSVPAGTIGDRMDRRRILMVSHAVPAVMSLALAALVLLGAVRLWHAFAYSLVVGLAAALEKPASSGLMYDLVGRERLFGASALHFLAGSLIRVVGAVAGGYVIDALGVGQNYVLIGAAHTVSVACVLPLRVPTSTAPAAAAFLAATREGLAYALRTPPIRRYLWLSLLTEGFGFSYGAMLPVLARDVLGVGGLGLGYLTAAGGLGRVAATIGIAGRSHVADERRIVLTAAFGFGILIALFGLSPWFPLSLVLAAGVGGLGAVYDAGMATALLLGTADAMRARVQGLYNSTIGFNLISGFGLGILATFLGVPVALAIAGAVTAGSALVLGHERHATK